MSILFISYSDLDRNTSGSGVRPAKMLKAFECLEKNVFPLTGEQTKRGERINRIKETEKWLKSNKPSMCYIESPTYPIMLRRDRKLIRKIHKLGIPIGYFYRDFYRKFPDLFPRKKGLINSLKEIILDILQWLTDRTLRSVDIVYVPSEEAKSLFSYKDMRALPPAGENLIFEKKMNRRTLIYVGGISKHYGFDILLDAIKILNKENDSYRLIGVCRETEWKKFEHDCKNEEWLEIMHVSGQELEKCYHAAAAAVVPKRNNEYNQLAVSVKLFEYISYGLPIVQISSKAMDKIVSEDNMGIITGESPQDLAEGIESLFSNNETYCRYTENAENALLNKHLWWHRAEQVISELAKVGKEA